jgi:exodeoxyribonuclease-3
MEPEARERFRRFLDAGWTDAIRTLHPSRPMYSFWDYTSGSIGTETGACD